MEPGKFNTKVNGKEIAGEFIARSAVTREQFMEMTGQGWMLIDADDLEVSEDKVIHAIAKKLNTDRFLYRWSYV